MEYLKQNWLEFLIILVCLGVGYWFIGMLSTRVVPWTDDLLTPRITVPMR